jgi:drug/metabolite transporter (DMT)-like permease
MTSSWMIVAGFLFATMAVFVKLGAEYFGAAEMALYRSLFSLALVLGIVAAHRGRATLRTKFLPQHLMRGFVGSISLIGYFYAITKLPVATANTLNYTSPIFLAIATTVVMGERFPGALLLAIVMGFAGVAVLLRPTFAAGGEGPAVIGLLSGIFSAWAYLSVRTLGRLGEPDWRVLFFFAAVASVMCAAWTAMTGAFHAITLSNLWILLSLGLCGTLAQLAMTRAYRTGNTLVVGAFSYSTVLFATIATVVIWKEPLGLQEILGMVIIAASGVLAMRVEKKEVVEEAGFES